MLTEPERKRLRSALTGRRNYGWMTLGCGLLTILLVAFGLLDIYQYGDVKSWPQVDARVDSFEMDYGRMTGKRTGGNVFQPTLRYSYMVDGQTHHGSLIDNTLSNGRTKDEHEADLLSMRFVPGSMIRIAHSPRDPALAVAIPENCGAGGMLVFAFPAALFTAFGLMGYGWARLRLRKFIRIANQYAASEPFSGRLNFQ